MRENPSLPLSAVIYFTLVNIILYMLLWSHHYLPFIFTIFLSIMSTNLRLQSKLMILKLCVGSIQYYFCWLSCFFVWFIYTSIHSYIKWRTYVYTPCHSGHVSLLLLLLLSLSYYVPAIIIDGKNVIRNLIKLITGKKRNTKWRRR